MNSYPEGLTHVYSTPGTPAERRAKAFAVLPQGEGGSCVWCGADHRFAMAEWPAAERAAHVAAAAVVESTREGKPLGVWIETDEEAFDDGLNCLPPAKMWRNGHAVGEAYSTTPGGLTVFVAFHESAGRYWRALVTLRDLDRYLATVPA